MVHAQDVTMAKVFKMVPVLLVVMAHFHLVIPHVKHVPIIPIQMVMEYVKIVHKHV